MSDAPPTAAADDIAAILLDPAHNARCREFYLSLGELLRRYEQPGAPADPRMPLTAYELRVLSQNGEDGVLAEILRRLGIRRGTFAEIGAGDGSESTCLALADLLGWSGLFVEADERSFARLEHKYERREDVVTRQVLVTPDNVQAVVAAGDVDVLAIDTDGRDYWLWRALDAVRPRVLVVEYNGSLPLDEPLTVPHDHEAAWDGTRYFGASLAAFEDLAAARGLRLVHTDLAGVNAFFVREEPAGAFPDADVVPRVRANYGLAGLQHAPDPLERPFVTPPPV